ncbi:MAG: hypothetical protein QM802_14070 [Agriterribacter sp.]
MEQKENADKLLLYPLSYPGLTWSRIRTCDPRSISSLRHLSILFGRITSERTFNSAIQPLLTAAGVEPANPLLDNRY